MRVEPHFGQTWQTPATPLPPPFRRPGRRKAWAILAVIFGVAVPTTIGIPGTDVPPLVELVLLTPEQRAAKTVWDTAEKARREAFYAAEKARRDEVDLAFKFCRQAQREIAARLKAPSTAVFASCWPGNPGSYVVRQGNTWTVHTIVDAQNSFGAQLRKNYIVVLRGADPYYASIVGLTEK